MAAFKNYFEHAVAKNELLTTVPSKKYCNSAKMSNILRNVPESRDHAKPQEVALWLLLLQTKHWDSSLFFVFGVNHCCSYLAQMIRPLTANRGSKPTKNLPSYLDSYIKVLINNHVIQEILQIA